MAELKTIAGSHTSKLIIKKSVFITNVKYVTSEEEARAFLSDIREKFNDANHNVYTYIVGENCEIQRCSDDGEPPGTAGMPVLEVIKKMGLTNIIVVITRYFGGILLGAGGLVRAYTQAVQGAIAAIELVKLIPYSHFEISTGYDTYETIRNLTERAGGYVTDTRFLEVVSLNIYVPAGKAQNFYGEIKNFNNLTVTRGEDSLMAEKSR